MTQAFYPHLNEKCQQILCYYINGTGKTVMARITNIANWRFERIIFPQERLLFEAPSQAQLELHCQTETDTRLVDVIPCSYLKVQQESQPIQETLWDKIA